MPRNLIYNYIQSVQCIYENTANYLLIYSFTVLSFFCILMFSISRISNFQIFDFSNFDFCNFRGDQKLT